MLHEIKPAPNDPASVHEFAVRCDVPGCDLEIQGDTEELAKENACLIGFKFAKDGSGRHACPDCGKGVSPAVVAIKAQLAAHAAAMQAQADAGEQDDRTPNPDPTGWLN